MHVGPNDGTKTWPTAASVNCTSRPIQWRIQSGGGGGGGVVGVITPPLVAENFVCSNSNFSPTGAITPDHPPPLWPSPPPSENPVSAPAIYIYIYIYIYIGQGEICLSFSTSCEFRVLTQK